ncbi:MAG TPA: hypothetical protein VH277_10630, partial [Gemmatimonadaceae bacterium]|nr:hypothetical protein [Gemmatimonadaceae bacterium]
AAYLVASTVQAVLAQRLVRVICTECKTRVPAVATDLAELSRGAAVDHIWRGAGCPNCRGTGYRGRVGIYELLTMNDALRHAVSERRDASELRRIMVQDGTPTLRADGWRLVLEGVTTPEEVLRAAAN